MRKAATASIWICYQTNLIFHILGESGLVGKK